MFSETQRNCILNLCPGFRYIIVRQVIFFFHFLFQERLALGRHEWSKPEFGMPWKLPHGHGLETSPKTGSKMSSSFYHLYLHLSWGKSTKKIILKVWKAANQSLSQAVMQLLMPQRSPGCATLARLVPGRCRTNHCPNRAPRTGIKSRPQWQHHIWGNNPVKDPELNQMKKPEPT